jgi:PAS domain S-box-containing protein
LSQIPNHENATEHLDKNAFEVARDDSMKKSPKRSKNEAVVCSLDGRLNFLSFNQALLKGWGYKAEDLSGHNLISLVSAEDVPLTLEAMKEIISEKTALAFESRILHRDGKWLEISWSAYWCEVENKIVGIAHDITKERALERRRREAVQTVSHDLRSPLTSIQFSLEMLAAEANGSLSCEALQDVRSAQNNTARLINLVNDLLDLEKLESGSLRMNLTRLDLYEVLQKSVDVVRFLARSRRIELKVEPTELVVFADRDRLVQVLINMIANAIKFAPEQSAVSISSLADKGYAEVRVKDEGPGIPLQYQEEIFERFSQVREYDFHMADGAKAQNDVNPGSVAKDDTGTGLGLAICKSIIEEHEGAIGVDSEEGKGSTFWFRVPLFQKFDKVDKRRPGRPFSKNISKAAHFKASS